MLKKIVPIEARIDGFAEGAKRRAFNPRRKKPTGKSQEPTPEYSSWIGRWTLDAQTGYREWLAKRSMGPDEINLHIDTLFQRSWVEIRDTKDGIRMTTSSRIRRKLRRQVASFDYVLDGVTSLNVESPLGLVSMTASIEGTALVHIVNTPNGVETHRRQALRSPKGDRMMQTMIDAKGNTATLEYQRVK